MAGTRCRPQSLACRQETTRSARSNRIIHMFKTIARLGAAFIAAMGLSLSAAASTFSIDYSDLWGGGQPAPTEAGWGLNLIQQGDVIFGTMFVYGADNTARWFSVTLSPT